MKILVIGPNVWGRGDTLKEALKNASRPKKYIAYIAHPESRVDFMGNITFPMDYPPKEIDRKGVAASLPTTGL